jgi:F0F1-type ATP synthase assembly protein I
MAERPDEVAQRGAGGSSTPPHVESGGSPTASPSPKPKNAAPTWVGMSGLGFEFVAAILLPGALGWWIDRWRGTAPWFMLVLGLVGFVAGLRALMRAVNRPR